MVPGFPAVQQFLLYQAVLENTVSSGMGFHPCMGTSLFPPYQMVIGRKNDHPLQLIFEESTRRLANKILADPTHILSVNLSCYPPVKGTGCPLWAESVHKLILDKTIE